MHDSMHCLLLPGPGKKTLEKPGCRDKGIDWQGFVLHMEWFQGDECVEQRGKAMPGGLKKQMEQLDLRIIKKRIQDLQKQTAADLEAVTNMARLRYDYQASQLEGLLRLCDHCLELRAPKLEPKGA